MKIGLLVTARMGSTRLHDKHLKPLLGRPALSYLLERTENTFKAPVLEGLAQVFIATGNASANAALSVLSNDHVNLFHGDDDNIPLRHLQLAKTHQLDAMVSIDGDDLFCSPEAMHAVHEGLKQGLTLLKTTGYPFGMNAWGYSCEALAQAVSTQDHGVLETGWGRAFDAIEAKVIKLNCTDADKVRATLDYPLDLDFFNAVIAHIPEWQTLSTPDLVTKIVAQDLHLINASLHDVYWQNFHVQMNQEKTKALS
jgi:spore coat polysaccharide biosynthesis protein SpsF (cytidylyltransferase family)